MIKNIFLLLTALLTSYTVMYLSEKLFKGNKFQAFAKATVLILGVAASGILSAVGLALTMGQLPMQVAVLIFSLLTAAYFCYYPASSKRQLAAWMIIISVLSAFCIFGFYHSFDHNSLISFYLYLPLGLAAGFGLSFLFHISGKNRALYGQSLAFLLASFSIYLLMETHWSSSPAAVHSASLTEQPINVFWVAWLLLLISFTCGLFYKSKNKTSC
ncbi:hypothetical protein [Dyadobacter crusticola]|uniref:hypothetical protein n=1 Tax=Dyadobacter crusticola TaxID=292407 RepID=UPI0004E282C1|nr:hypothetical protein [Dyadobacter crusticola]